MLYQGKYIKTPYRARIIEMGAAARDSGFNVLAYAGIDSSDNLLAWLLLLLLFHLSIVDDATLVSGIQNSDSTTVCVMLCLP